MTSWQSRTRDTLGTLALLTLAACGSTQPVAAVPSSTPMPSPTVTPTSTHVASSGPPTTFSCSADTMHSEFGPIAQVGQVLMQVKPNPTMQVEGRDVTSALLTAGTPRAPINAMTIPNSKATDLVDITSYAVEVCNLGTQPLTLTGLSTKLASFTPQTTPVDWTTGDCGYIYDKTHGVTLGACDYVRVASFTAAATFPTGASAGTQATMQVTGIYPPGTAAYPKQIPAGESAIIIVNVKGLTAPGAYAYTFTASLSGSSAPVSVQSKPYLAYLPDKPWDGRGCIAATMQSQIPSSSTLQWVCPPAA